jgi:GntR family transcriptional regulator of abcA and norABC
MREQDEAPRTVRDVVSWLVAGIHEGVWPPETRLPPERTLAEQLGIHRSTAAAAYLELQARGLVDRRQGSGTYVHGDLWGIAPDWARYLDRAAFRPMEPLVQKVWEARQRPEMIDFSQADIGRTLWPRDALRELMAEIDLASGLGFTSRLGLPALRQAIAEEMQHRSGIVADPESILITSGAQQALYLLARGLLHPGDAIAIERPSFYYSQALFQSAGIRLLPIPMDDEGILPDELERLIVRDRPAMAWLNPTFHNPTTTTLSLERRQRVLELCGAWNLPVVEDDAFGYLAVDGTKVPPPLRRLGPRQSVIYVGTISKIAAPGLRIGWIVAPHPIVTRLADIKSQIDFGTPGLVQALVAAFLASPAWPGHVEAVQRALRTRRDAFCEELQPLADRGASWTVPTGGLYVWVRFGGSSRDRDRLERAIRAGVVYGPGAMYGAEDGFARLNYAYLPREQAAEGIRWLATI